MLSFQRTPSIGHNQINGMAKGNQGMLFRRYVFVMPGLQLCVVLWYFYNTSSVIIFSNHFIVL